MKLTKLERKEAEKYWVKNWGELPLPKQNEPFYPYLQHWLKGFRDGFKTKVSKDEFNSYRRGGSSYLAHRP